MSINTTMIVLLCRCGDEDLIVVICGEVAGVSWLRIITTAIH